MPDLDRLFRIRPRIVLVMWFLSLCAVCLKAEAFENIEYIGQFSPSLSSPVDIALLDNQEIIILDEQDARIIFLDPQGQTMRIIGARGSRTGQFRRPRSLAVSPRGTIIVADTGNDRIQVFDTKGDFLFAFGNSGSRSGEFSGPAGVAVDPDGYIYVADYGNKRIQSFTPRGVFISALATDERPLDIELDLQKNIYVLQPETGVIAVYSPDGEKKEAVSFKTKGRNFVKRGRAIAVDRRGDLYMTERGEHSVKKTDGQNLLLSFGSQGEGRGQFEDPAGLAVDKTDRIFVADAANQRIQVFKVSGTQKKPLETGAALEMPVIEFASVIPSGEGIADLFYQPGKGLFALSDERDAVLSFDADRKVFGREGRESGEFRGPEALFVDHEGRLFVADSQNQRVQILSPEGRPLHAFGTGGDLNGQFRYPRGIAVNSRERIYVADTLNDRIQIFSKDGIFLKAFGDELLPGGEKTLQSPEALAVDSRDRIYAVDTEHHQISVFDELGTRLMVLGKRGGGPGEFNQPVDVAVDEKDFLYVADRGNNRVQVFDPRGRWLFAFGAYGQGPSFFPSLSGVEAASGKIYVANEGMEQIKVFDFEREKFGLTGSTDQEVVPLGKKTEGDANETTAAVHEKKVPEKDVPSTEDPVQEEKASVAVEPEVKEKARRQSVQSENETEKATEKVSEKKAEKVMEEEAANEAEKETDASLAAEDDIRRVLDETRVYVTKTFYLPPSGSPPADAIMQKVRLLTTNEALKTLAEKTGMPIEKVKNYAKVEHEEMDDGGTFKLTLSVPKDLREKEHRSSGPEKRRKAGNSPQEDDVLSQDGPPSVGTRLTP